MRMKYQKIIYFLKLKKDVDMIWTDNKWWTSQTFFILLFEKKQHNKEKFNKSHHVCIFDDIRIYLRVGPLTTVLRIV